MLVRVRVRIRVRVRVRVRVRTKSWLVLDFGFLAAEGRPLKKFREGWSIEITLTT